MCSFVFLASAQAQMLEEVVVTAQKRVESLQDVPISVSAINGTKIVQAGITELQDMTAYVPNLTMNETGIGTNITIRGVSSGINQGFEQSAGMYIDGIYYGRAQLARAPFLDIERAEVLRGPQSILFGKNSIAGAISLTTAKPTDEFEGSFTALYEPGDEEYNIRGVVSGPFSENFRGRVALLISGMDGYYDNTTNGRGEPNEDEMLGRATFEWDVTADLTATLKVEAGSFDAKGRFLEAVNPVELPGGTPYSAVLGLFGTALETDQNFDRQSNGDISNNETMNVTFTAEYAWGEHTITSITGYNGYEFDEECDCDFIDAVVFTADQDEEFDQISQEIRIASPVGETIEYIGGFFYQHSDLDFRDGINVPTNSILPPALFAATGGLSPALAGASTQRTFEQESDLWAVFAQVTWNVTDDWRLTVGGRYTDEQKDASRRQFHVDAAGVDNGFANPLLNTLFGLFRIEPYATVNGSRSEDRFTPHVNLQWDATDDAMLYFTYSEGFKAGGFDVRSNASPDPTTSNAIHTPTFLGVLGATGDPVAAAAAAQLTGVLEYEEEVADTFELGGKFTLLNGAAELNIALYRTEYTDLQTSQFDGTLGFNVTNAGEATVQGIEIDGRWAVTDNLTLIGAFAHLDFEYDRFPNAQCAFGQAPNSTTNPGLCDVSGQRREYTPSFTGNLTGDHTWAISDNLEVHTTLDLIYMDDYIAAPTLDTRLSQDAYMKVNARIGVGAPDGSWEIAVVGRNLTDQEVVTFGNILPVSTTLTGGTGTAYYGFYDRPRSIAVQGSIRF